ncbi:MAG: hypothetical protein FWF77_03780 [Defluviitaleaceae bacterium]|nr:hypothetical protein [Defluviitaleaceae bacterium]
MSAATHSLEAGSNFPTHKEARQARTGHQGQGRVATTHSGNTPLCCPLSNSLKILVTPRWSLRSISPITIITNQ